jgi:DNA repair protein RecO (recombination protein O)
VGLVGAEAMLRLFPEQEANARAFEAVTRFLDACDVLEPTTARAAHDPLALSFQLKLLWLSGYQPHTQSCAECGAGPPLAGYLPRAGGAVCRACTEPGTVAVSPYAFAAVEALLHRPLAEAHAVAVGEREAREILGLITAAYEFHGGFRLRTLSA